jgi:hypothetical protein
MAGGRLEVFWSPNSQDKFITWGSDISLYQVKNTSVRDDISSTHRKKLYYLMIVMCLYFIFYFRLSDIE